MKEYNTELNKNKTILYLENDKSLEKISEILHQYENGISSIFEINKEVTEENYFLLLLKCPDVFHQKFSNLNKTNPKSLKYYENNNIQDLSNSQSITINIEIKNEEKSNKYIGMIRKIFDKFFGGNEYLLDELIIQYLKAVKKESKKEFDYEDFIVIFCSIIKYYTGFNISLELNDLNKFLLIFIYGDNESYTNICNLFNYELQMKPIAIDFEKNKYNSKKVKYEELEFKDIEIIDYNENEPLLQSFIPNEFKKNLQYEDYDINNPIFWPPYYPYKPEKKDKFREYVSNDDYYFPKNKNDVDGDFNKENCSHFRNIDKLRFIQRVLSQIIQFSELKKTDVFELMLFKRNHVAYKEKLKELEIQKIYNPFDYKLCNRTINIIRNYYGESVSYYFLWIDYYSRWLLFPSILGIFIFISYFLWKKIPLISIFSNTIQMDYYDFLLIMNCTLLTIWLTLFIKTWSQKEKLYNYIWGINEGQKETKINEEFVLNSKEKLIFGYYVPVDKEKYHILKKTISYIVLLGMILLVIIFIYDLFRLKAKLINGNIWHDYKISIFIACANGIQIKVMNYIYQKIAEYLIKWENHFSLTEKNNSLATKLILFDFMNSYSSLFYIAFVKPYKEGCINNNCLKEIETQMYSIFLIYLCVFFGELLYLYLIYYYQKGKAGSLIREEKIEIQGLEHQIMTYPMDTLNIEYNDIINQFGFACLFSIAAPLTPLILFVLALVCRLTNYYKFINLRRVEIFDKSKGISFYKKIIKVFIFIGVMVNVSIFLFSIHTPSKYISPINNTIGTIKYKLLTIFLIENSLLIIYFFVDWNILPKWFKYKDIIKDLYLNKYFFKDDENKNKQYII